eukprot:TRINITY_DN1397_c0_g1_i1.p1 TRINITY_DN1397_c0_g1~~TRINITY_DN1397_c0_g1_i1.p1  ORF type:complete len:350 (+),score=48.26 TRINITY_DN1397_c0_g1_i1:181-1230(+)
MSLSPEPQPGRPPRRDAPVQASHVVDALLGDGLVQAWYDGPKRLSYEQASLVANRLLSYYTKSMGEREVGTLLAALAQEGLTQHMLQGDRGARAASTGALPEPRARTVDAGMCTAPMVRQTGFGEAEPSPDYFDGADDLPGSPDPPPWAARVASHLSVGGGTDTPVLEDTCSTVRPPPPVHRAASMPLPRWAGGAGHAPSRGPAEPWNPEKPRSSAASSKRSSVQGAAAMESTWAYSKLVSKSSHGAQRPMRSVLGESQPRGSRVPSGASRGGVVASPNSSAERLQIAGVRMAESVHDASMASMHTGEGGEGRAAGRQLAQPISEALVAMSAQCERLRLNILAGEDLYA